MISEQISPNVVFSTLPFTTRAALTSLSLMSDAVMIGVLIFLDALMISLIRGTPRVMFIDATPAKWNVFSVICVPGSPMDCAPMAPTAVPGSIRFSVYFRAHASKNAFICRSDMYTPSEGDSTSLMMNVLMFS